MHLKRKFSHPFSCVNKGTTQGSVSGPYLVNVFLNDLEITGDSSDNIDLNKYADDSTLQITVRKDGTDNTQNTLRLFMDWTTLKVAYYSFEGVNEPSF